MARNKFDMDEDLNSSVNIHYLRRVVKYVIPYKKEIIITTILMLFCAAINMLGPYLTKVALDTTIPNKDVKGLLILSVIYFLSQIINSAGLQFKINKMNHVGQDIILNMRKDLFEHLQELPFTYYDTRPHGKILVRVVNYVNSLSDLLSTGIINLFTDMFTLIIIIAFMFAINVRLTLICLASMPFLIAVAFVIKTLQRKSWRRLNNKLSNLNAYIHESICGVKVTQAFARENTNMDIFLELNGGYKKAWMRCIRIQFLVSPFVDNISNIVICCIYVLGITWLNGGASDVSIGVLVAFLGYMSRFWAPISNIANTYNSIINGLSYLERIFETLDEEVTVKDKENAIQMPVINGTVEFENVNFSYDPGHKILNDINFSVPPGHSVALVGPTGAGKTTIINLLSRFYNIDEGKVLIDGVDISSVTLNSLRSQMGVMLQDSFIFSGSIMDNIRYGKLDATDEEVIEAAKVVRAHEFIKDMENGYYTYVNERGSRLSAGQRQLIAFARALLANPAILILDEATSSIDTNTEILLQQGLQELLKGRTSFIIAHRLSTIKNSKLIMYIDKGSIVEKGTHEELMELKGNYYELYTSQYKFLEAI
ncbi:ABC transporter ATP-binding protein [Clostridium oryzae]|uniref:Putative ABC transporter ATP-binding protein n=1 Tax=Clostridium oryzae TaxID=1450648 RepID=A0A1V4J0D9_9CLOT|nr:ABC transporter ATP-binding protein [Clostridium oryzae]OPJ65117.1 putative ABC transporter ATP-binding protein [Clostridium oryzae]